MYPIKPPCLLLKSNEVTMKCVFFGMKSHGFVRNHLWSQADSRISFLSFWDRFLARAVRKKLGKSAGNGDFMVAQNPGHDEFSWWFHQVKS